MLPWRYHVMSLVAVFLALGLGITIGISLGDNGAIDLSQENLVNDIRRDIDETRQENDALSAERSINLRFQDNTFPYLVGGRLQGKRVALVSSSTVGDDVREGLDSAIQTAGGQVVSTTVLNSRFDDAAVIERMSRDLQAYPKLAAVDETTLASVLGGQLALEIGSFNPPLSLDVLKGQLVDSASGSYDMPVDAVILVTSADNDYAASYSDLEREFLLKLKNAGVAVVGCEPSYAPRSEIPMFIAVGIASVDNVESRIGQLSAVYALAGERDSYGVKPTSDMLIPILRLPQEQVPGAG